MNHPTPTTDERFVTTMLTVILAVIGGVAGLVVVAVLFDATNLALGLGLAAVILGGIWLSNRRKRARGQLPPRPLR